MSDDVRGNRYSRTTKARWSVFEPQGHDDEMRDDDAGDDAPDDGREAAAVLDPLLVAVAGELRRPVTLDAALDERIMALVAAEPRPRRETVVGASPSGGAAPSAAGEAALRAWSWLRRPRLVRITPLGGLSAVAGLAALVLVAVRLGGPSGQAAAVSLPVAAATVPAAAPASAPADSIQVVQFVLVAPGAQTVALVGDFNDWQAGATPLRAAAAGRVWSVEVPLTAGGHRYAFVVDDDRWVPDPSAPRAAGDDFGTPSSVVTVADRRS
jgi:hypothetical protein